MLASTVALAAYLENAALGWMKLPDCDTHQSLCDSFEKQEAESVDAVHVRIHEVATMAASILRHDGTEARAEDPIWKDDKDGARTGLLLMHVAFHETRFRGYVDDGRCNSPEWRASAEGARLLKLGTCDGTRAFGLWQVHPESRGFWLTWDGTDVNQRAGDVRVDAAALVGSRELEMVTALHMLRKSVRATGGLRWYTGEWTGPATKAAVRLDGALAYERARPFVGQE